MKKIAIAYPLLAIALLGASAPSPAAQDSPQVSSMQEFLARVRLKLDGLMPHRTQTATTAVSGVRGYEVSASDVYWKGEARPVTVAQLDQLKDALAHLEEGRTERAKLDLQNFLKDHPESELRSDALAALGLISAR